MPTKREIEAAEQATFFLSVRHGADTARELIEAALTAAEKVREEQAEDE